MPPFCIPDDDPSPFQIEPDFSQSLLQQTPPRLLDRGKQGLVQLLEPVKVNMTSTTNEIPDFERKGSTAQ
jgi:hypothetical protein